MSRKGFNIVAYLDDFFICEATKDLCSKGLRSLVQLLRKLGFLEQSGRSNKFANFSRRTDLFA